MSRILYGGKSISLRPEFFDPFDITYALVTARVLDHASSLPAREREWLITITADFLAQRQAWSSKPELRPYLAEWGHLKKRYMRLVAAAYLHIAYDLPRVLADQWPGTGVWVPRPNVQQGHSVYFALDQHFPHAFTIVASNPRVFGMPAFGFRLLKGLGLIKGGSLDAASHWALLLRAHAWNHGSFLVGDPARAFREDAMLKAITEALADVVKSRRWLPGTLYSPDHVFSAAAPSAIPLFTSANPDVFWLGALAVSLLIGTGGAVLAWRMRKIDELRLFAELLGQRTHDYVLAAVRDPKGFAEYRERYLAGERPVSRGQRNGEE